MRRIARRQDGYVLVLTLGIIALASIALASLARHSLRLAASANQSADELQARWGLLSVRHVLLDRASPILEAQVSDDQASTPPWPKPSHLSTQFKLGNQRFSVTISDEDAKLNLNTVYTRKRDRTHQAIRNLQNAGGAAFPDVLLVPSSNNRTPFTNLGQVFDLSRIGGERTVGSTLASVGREITCWGSGRLNLRRASDAAVRETAALALPAKEVGRLLEERRNWGGQGIDELLDTLKLRRPQYLAARRLLDSESRSYSLWIEVNDGQRQRDFMFVDNGRPINFAW